METLRSLRTPSFKLSISGFDSPLGLACVFIVCALLSTEVLLTCGVSLALLQLLGQISQSKKKIHASPSKLPPGLPPPELHLHSSTQRPARPRVQSNVPLYRTHTASRVSRPTPPRPVKVQVSADNTDSEAMNAALEAYEAVGASQGLSPEELLPLAPNPDTSLSNLSSGLLGRALFPGGVANRVSEVLLASLPQIRIFNFSRTRGTDGNVLPALEVVIFMQSNVVSTACLQERLQRGMRGARAAGSPGEVLSGQKLQKSVLRHCLSLLVDNGFKFRRSAFKAEAPTVFLLAPLESADGEAGASVELSVNNPLPLLNAALVWEAALVDNRAPVLIASVQRWADARGLAHISFGPLNIYAWAHLAIFYLQTQATHRMPPLLGRAPPPGLGPEPVPEPPPLDATYLQGFFEFLAQESLWKSGSVVLRGRPKRTGVFIADAFRSDSDLGVELRIQDNAIARVRAEAMRAIQRFATPGGTVADLLARPDFRGPVLESGDCGDVYTEQEAQ